jgi:GNAT superfamily N-acetyltransferase
LIALRPASADDAEAIATLDFTTRHAAMPGIAWAHPLPEVVRYFADHMIPAGGVVMAEAGGDLVGHMDAHGGWVHQLYVRKSHWRAGIGSMLMARAKAENPGGLQLWCFQVNARGRAFYEKHGFRVAKMTDGADNEEREPDILYVWDGGV